jgi:hypothetical protein
MGKFSLAARLADEAGTSLSKSKRFVEEVGAPKVERLLDDAAQSGSSTVEKWWKPALGAGAIGGGGALAWRQQELETARSIADQQQGYTEAVTSIMDSDLSPEKKRNLVDSLISNSPSSGSNTGGGGGAGGGDGGGGLLGNDIQTTIVLMVVLAFALRYTLGDE